MRIVFISDTHGQHRNLTLPDGDMIIHAGDITMSGRVAEIEAFIEWFSSLNYKHKLFIAGNHDFFLEHHSVEAIQSVLPQSVHYLCNSGVEIEGLNIYGSPITPYFWGLAFNHHRGDDIRRYWDMIPHNTDILITHGAPHGILDKTVRGDLTGCEDLLTTVKTIKPKYHLFGHIHESYGTHKTDQTTFINGCVLDESYSLLISL